MSGVNFFCPSMLITCQMNVKKYPHWTEICFEPIEKKSINKTKVAPGYDCGVSMVSEALIFFLSSVQHTEFGTLRNGGDGYEKKKSKNTNYL